MTNRLRLFTVDADAETGEWLPETLTEVGDIDRAEHIAKLDTDAEHYDIFEQDDETCAIIVRWA